MEETNRTQRETEERLRLALDAAAMGTFMWYPLEDRSEPDARTYAIYGFSPGSPLDLATALARLIHPGDRDRYAQAVHRATDPAGDGKLYEEIRIRRPGGEERWVAMTGQAYFEGEPPCAVRMAGVVADITDRKRNEQALRLSEARQSFLLRLSDALRPLENPTEIKTMAMRVLGEHLNLSRALFVDIDEISDTGIVESEYLNGVPSIAGPLRVSDFGRGAEKLRSGQELMTPDVAHSLELGEPDKIALLSLGIAATANVPLVKGGRWVANLSAHQSVPRNWTEEDVSLLWETAERTWAAVEHARAEEALVKSEEKYRTLFESIDEGFCTIQVLFDDEGKPFNYRFLDLNAAFIRQTDLTDAIGKTMLDFAPEMESHWFEMYGRVATTGEPVRFENHAEQLHRWYGVYAFRVGVPKEHKVGVLFNDITERKRSETNLAFLNEVSQDLARLTNIDETMNALGAKIAAHLGLSACAFAELNETTGIGVINHGWHRSDVPSLLGTYRIEEFVTPEILQFYRAGEAVVIRDVFDDPRTVGERYAALNIGSFISIPLVRDGEWRFLLVVYQTEPCNWRNDEIEVTRELANRIWTRLEHARAEDEAATLNVRLQRAMQETHHRIKNNLQVIAALLEMPSSDGKAVSAEDLRRINAHVRALAAIHDLLTLQAKDDHDMAALDARDVLSQLLPLLEGMTKGRRLLPDIEAFPLPIQQSAALALLVNELISNAVKHGAGDIEISLRRIGDAPNRARLEVCDSGPGFPDGFDSSQSANTGLELIESAARWDLCGDVAFDNRAQGGGRVTITFPVGGG